MTDELIHNIAALMQEQAVAYERLDSACAQLCAALVGGSAVMIESLTRAGDSEMLRMRARLVQIMSALAAFADQRALSPPNSPVNPEARAAFESASNNLLHAARTFERTRARANALTTGATTFASSCIEMCGVPPTTYRAPYARNTEGRTWA